ncbi:thioredoxin domain-containing protein [Rugamonas rivuli]|uniref:Thioredoxin domain-containing protein n=1 Tax=Rugamonas rivuli TaxID=2743358 RepID=A0A843SHC3_9BURK|nr:hypothetical protein [Rugamonas rivuli]MQA23699.1 hypothetical protein [Rugamonas rivuli]
MLESVSTPRRRALRLAAGLGAWAAATPLVRAARPAALELAPRVFEEYVWSLHLPQTDAALLYQAYYAQRLRAAKSVGQLKSMTTREVAAAFDALYAIIFYTADQQVLAHLYQVYALLEQRMQVTPLQRQQTYNACYYCRRLDLARRLAQRFPDRLKTAPEIRMSTGAGVATPTLMHLVSGRSELFATAAPLPLRPTVLMITNPGCHFSQNAFTAMKDDPMLMRRLNGSLQLLAPHQMDLDVDDFIAWNQQYPSLPISLAYHWRGWTMLDMRQTPTFYFVKEGKVRHVMTGWRDNADKLHLADGLSAIDL